MRQETIIKTYLQFNELTEKQKEKIIDKHYSINVEHEWYDSTYDDAKTIGAKISGFDLDRGNNIDFKFTKNALLVAIEIMKNHGKTCETYKLAKAFKKEIKKTKDCEYAEDLCNEFENAIGQEYLLILKKEYDYLTSREAIIETIEANEMEFDKETL